MSYNTGPQIIKDNMICCFDAANSRCFNSGNDILMNLGNPRYNAQISNMPHSNNGALSYFNTSGDNNFSMLTAIPMPITSGFTFFMVFKPLYHTGLGWNYFYEQGGGGANRYEFGWYNPGIGLAFKNNANSSYSYLNVTTNTSWHMVAFGASITGNSFGWNSLGNLQKFYSAQTGWVNGTDLSVSHFFRDSPNGVGAPYYCHWNFIAVYDKELNNEELQQNYNVLKRRLQ